MTSLQIRIFAASEETALKIRQLFADENIPLVIEEEQQFLIGGTEHGPKFETACPKLGNRTPRLELFFWDGKNMQEVSIDMDWISSMFIRPNLFSF